MTTVAAPVVDEYWQVASDCFLGGHHLGPFLGRHHLGPFLGGHHLGPFLGRHHLGPFHLPES